LSDAYRIQSVLHSENSPTEYCLLGDHLGPTRSLDDASALSEKGHLS